VPAVREGSAVSRPNHRIPGFLLVANPRSGDDAGGAKDLSARARERLGDVETLWLEPGVDLGEEVGRASRESRAVIAAGGDGTVNAVVQQVAGSDTVLGVLPAGTLNHFARDLGVRDEETALDALAEGQVARIDAGRAGDRYFVNNAGIGLYPELVYERERHEHRVGKWRASLTAARRILGTAEPVVGTIAADGDRRALLAWAVFVGNNLFGTQTGRIGTRERLDQGVLDLRLLTVSKRRASKTRFAWRVLRSRQWRGRRLVRRPARTVEVSIVGEPRLVSWDGESGPPVSAIRLEVVPGALRVVVPGPGMARGTTPFGTRT
jgi:diacylglycerol kinase family enzyme